MTEYRGGSVPKKETTDTPAMENTDREIWRELKGDYYADSIHVTKEGAIGINCGGLVIVMPLRDWHKAGKAIIEQHQQPSVPVSIIKDLRRQCYDIATAKIPKEQSKFGKGFEAGNTAAYSDFVDELDALIHQAEKLKEQEKQS